MYLINIKIKRPVWGFEIILKGVLSSGKLLKSIKSEDGSRCDVWT
jgi:hypothetical protein